MIFNPFDYSGEKLREKQDRKWYDCITMCSRVGESENPAVERLREGALSQNDDALFLFVGK